MSMAGHVLVSPIIGLVVGGFLQAISNPLDWIMLIIAIAVVDKMVTRDVKSSNTTTTKLVTITPLLIQIISLLY
jgi:hypothetical protein